jgi:hypothetical protein
VFTISQSNTSNVATTNYSFLLPNGANLLISLLLFLQPINVSFAGTTTTYASNTLKLAIRIEDWSFVALTNLLVVTIDVTGFSPSLVGKCDNASENGSDEQGSLRWFTIQSGPYVLYGQMLNVGVLDGRNRALLFSRNSTTSEIRVKMPHFWSYAGKNTVLSPFILLIANISTDLDPNFSVLLDEPSHTGCDYDLDSNPSKRLLYYPIIVGIIVGFFVVLVLVFIFVRHR